MDQELFEERMKAPHLDDSTESLKKAVDLGLQAEPEEDPKLKLMNEKEYTFELDHHAARGKVWKGKFTTKILSIKERQLVGALRSRMAGSDPLESLDPLTVELNLMMAHLAYSLVEKPEWAANLDSLEDIGVLQAIYAEVALHESRFLGWTQD